MRTLPRLAAISLLGIPLFTVIARAQGRDMGFDFKMTDSGTTAMQSIHGVSTGHAIVSKGRVRIDARGNARALAMPGAAAGDDVTLIMLDSGKTLIYINTKTKRYMQLNPIEAMDRMQKMMEGMGASMKVDFTGDPKVENLGSGPEILGHKTRHYRVTTGIMMTMTAMGETQTMEMSAVADEYLALDLRNRNDPFRNMSSNAMGGMMGGPNKAYLERLKAVQAKLPNAMELRAETHITVGSAGQTQNMTTVREITGIQNTTASADQFAVPAGYTKIDFPLGPGGGRVPPE